MTTPCAVLLSVCIGVGGRFCPIYSRAWPDRMDSLQLANSALSSASADDDMTALMIFSMVNTAPFLGGNAVLLNINKCTPALLLDSVLERYEASLWPARTISLAWYVMMKSGCVVT